MAINPNNNNVDNIFDNLNLDDLDFGLLQEEFEKEEGSFSFGQTDFEKSSFPEGQLQLPAAKQVKNSAERRAKCVAPKDIKSFAFITDQKLIEEKIDEIIKNDAKRLDQYLLNFLKELPFIWIKTFQERSGYNLKAFKTQAGGNLLHSLARKLNAPEIEQKVRYLIDLGLSPTEEDYYSHTAQNDAERRLNAKFLKALSQETQTSNDPKIVTTLQALRNLNELLSGTTAYRDLINLIEKRNVQWGTSVVHLDWNFLVQLFKQDEALIEFILKNVFATVYPSSSTMRHNLNLSFKRTHEQQSFNFEKATLQENVSSSSSEKMPEALVRDAALALIYLQKQVIEEKLKNPELLLTEIQAEKVVDFLITGEDEKGTFIIPLQAHYNTYGWVSKVVLYKGTFRSFNTNCKCYLSPEQIAQLINLGEKTNVPVVFVEQEELRRDFDPDIRIQRTFQQPPRMVEPAISNKGVVPTLPSPVEVIEVESAKPISPQFDKKGLSSAIEGLLELLDPASQGFNALHDFIEKKNAGYWGLTLQHLGKDLRELLATLDDKTLEIVFNQILTIVSGGETEVSELQKAHEKNQPGSSFDFKAHAQGNKRTSSRVGVPPELSVRALLYLQRSIAKWKLKNIGQAVPKNILIEAKTAPLFIFNSGKEGLYLQPFAVQFTKEGWAGHVDSIDNYSQSSAALRKILGTTPEREEGIYILDQAQKETLFKYLEEKKEEELPFILISKGSLLLKEDTKSDPIIRGMEKFEGIASFEEEEENSIESFETAKKSTDKVPEKERTIKRKKKSIQTEKKAEQEFSFFAELSKQGIVNLRRTIKKRKQEELGSIKELNTVSQLQKEKPLLSIEYFNPQLKPYQNEAVKRTLELKEKGINGAILALDTGLGKTKTMIELAHQLLMNDPHSPIVVIPTASTSMQIEFEFLKEFSESCLSFLKKEISKLGQDADEYKYLYYNILKLIDEASERAKEKDCYPEKRGLLTRFIEQAERIKDELIEKAKETIFIGPNRIRLDLNRFSKKDLRQDLFSMIESKKDFRLEIFSGNQILFQSLGTLKKYHQKTPQAIFVDEAHKVHNDKSKTYEQLKNLIEKDPAKRPFLLLSTATPFQNDLSDIFTYLSLITSTSSNELRAMNEQFNNEIAAIAKEFWAYYKADENKKAEVLDEIAASLSDLLLQFEEFRLLLDKLAITEKKNDQKIIDQWGGSLPKVEYRYVDLTFSEKQGLQEETIKKIDSEFFKMLKINKKTSFFELKDRFAKAFIHPNLGIEYKDIIQFSSESALLEYFTKNREEVEKALSRGAVFFVERLEAGRLLKKLLEVHYKIPEVDFLHGENTKEQRGKMIRSFESPIKTGEKRALIISVGAGREGIDLKVNGETAYMLFEDYNPSNINQTENRIVRSGSLKEKVQIVFFNYQSEMQRHSKWHLDRKELMSAFIFDKEPLTKENFNKRLGQLIQMIAFHMAYPRYKCITPLILGITDVCTNLCALDKDLVIKEGNDFSSSLNPKKLKRPAEPNENEEPQIKKSKMEEEQGVKRALEESLALPSKKIKQMQPKPLQTQLAVKLPQLNEAMSQALKSIGGPMQITYQTKAKKFHILPLRTSFDRNENNRKRALYAGSNLVEQNPLIVQEIITSLKNNPQRAFDARTSTSTLQKHDPRLHHLLWNTLQLNDRFINEGAYRITIYDPEGNKIKSGGGNNALPKIRLLKTQHPETKTDHYDLLVPQKTYSSIDNN